MTSGKNSKNKNDDVGYAAAGLVGLTLAFGPAAVVPAAVVGATIGFFGQLLFSKDEEINDEFKKDVEKYFSSIDLTEEQYNKAFDRIKNELNNRVNHQSYYYYGKLYLALFYNYLGNDIYGKHKEREVAFYLLAILNKYYECEIKEKEFNYNELYISLINNYLVNEVYKVNDFKKLKLVKNNKNQYSNEIKNIVINTSNDYPINIVCLSSYMLSLCNILDKYNFEYKKDIIIFLFNKIIYEIYEKELNYQEVLIYINNYENFIKTYLLDKENEKNKNKQEKVNKEKVNYDDENIYIKSEYLEELLDKRKEIISEIDSMKKNKSNIKKIQKLFKKYLLLEEKIKDRFKYPIDREFSNYGNSIVFTWEDRNEFSKFEEGSIYFKDQCRRYINDILNSPVKIINSNNSPQHKKVNNKEYELIVNEIFDLIDTIDEAHKIIDELNIMIKVNTFNTELSKKIAKSIEKLYKFDISILDNYCFIKYIEQVNQNYKIVNENEESSNSIYQERIVKFINSEEDELLKENFEKFDRFLKNKTLVLDRYHHWLKNLLEYNKERLIKHQVSHIVFYEK